MDGSELWVFNQGSGKIQPKEAVASTPVKTTTPQTQTTR